MLGAEADQVRWLTAGTALLHFLKIVAMLSLTQADVAEAQTACPEFGFHLNESTEAAWVKVTIPAKLLDKDQAVAFIVIFEKNCKQPRILCDTAFTFPSLADGRDLFALAVRRPWTASDSLLQLIRPLVNLVFEIESVQMHRVNVWSVGSFAAGSWVPVDYWTNKPGMTAFPCQEKKEALTSAVLVVTHCAVLQFEQDRLVRWTPLSALNQLKRSKQNVLTLEWTAGTALQQFVLPDVHEFVQCVMQNSAALGISSNRRVASSVQIAEEDVSAAAMTAFPIAETVASIQELEQEGETWALMEKYQAAIEYYSAVDCGQYQEYLNKLHSLVAKTVS